MTEIKESGRLEAWNTTSCPFTIEYSRRVLDDIRLAVVDAFFSLPRGGAEIGGVLLGRFANGRVSILEYAPLECEHNFGPSFTLSPGDHERLAEMLAAVLDPMSDVRPVGWYHSHTRSDIFLSEADLDIHNRYFPEPWQVALVLRPSTFQPVQAGFFFREPDGTIRSKASYHEFALDPLPVGQMPRGMPAAIAQPASRQAEAEGQVITLMPYAVAAPAEPERLEHAVANAAVVTAAEPTPPPRPILLPPALPPLPTLEFVHDLDSRELVENDQAVPEPPLAVEPAPAPEAFAAPAEVETPEAPAEPELPIAALVVSTEPPAAAEPQIETAPAAETEVEPQPEPQLERPVAEPPSFLQMEPVRSRRRLWVVGAVAVAVVLGAGGYQQRANWLPQRAAAPPAPPPAPKKAPAPAAPVPLTLPLSASDHQGQLQITWDGAARAVTQARDGVLEITDDGATTNSPLDAAHLQSGEFTYVRRGEQVDARLTLQELDGTQVHTVTSFHGPLPEPVKPVAGDPALRKQNSELAKKNTELARDNGELHQKLEELGKQTAKLQSDLAARTASSKTSAELARQNAELRQQRDDLAKQTAQLKADLAARAAASKQAPTQSADFSKQRALVSQISQLQSELAAATTRADKLAKQLEEIRKQQTQRRLQNQSGETQ